MQNNFYNIKLKALSITIYTKNDLNLAVTC